ncbi:hypothetical protein L6164_002349 [Bauhinia variegata]|uniref:Uncharacterized protein n=1 Tax=Bauhinia variegata TaxID=167791 RepID=A0ACB9PXY4_BAUVA|nr:hypothetical protein L6164_002349 [Bauhinia variegata]
MMQDASDECLNMEDASSRVYQRVNFAWIGQDVIVGTVLLGCAFLYDIFWVFVSKWWFHESVMIVVA